MTLDSTPSLGVETLSRKPTGQVYPAHPVPDASSLLSKPPDHADLSEVSVEGWSALTGMSAAVSDPSSADIDQLVATMPVHEAAGDEQVLFPISAGLDAVEDDASCIPSSRPTAAAAAAVEEVSFPLALPLLCRDDASACCARGIGSQDSTR